MTVSWKRSYPSCVRLSQLVNYLPVVVCNILGTSSEVLSLQDHCMTTVQNNAITMMIVL